MRNHLAICFYLNGNRLNCQLRINGNILYYSHCLRPGTKILAVFRQISIHVSHASSRARLYAQCSFRYTLAGTADASALPGDRHGNRADGEASGAWTVIVA